MSEEAEDGASEGAVGGASEASEAAVRRQTEAVRRETEAVRRLEAMGAVAGRVAHDFNNLLTLIIGYSELLSRSLEDPQQRFLVDEIAGAARRAATLTQQMRTMTRQGEAAVVADLAVEIGNLHGALTRLAGPRIRLTITGPGHPMKVRMDPTEIEQIVISLVANACDAIAAEGRVAVGVDPETAEFDGLSRPGAVLVVSDDGPGMPVEVLDRCLEPFFTTKDQGRGSGLGLSTVLQLVSDRGGQLHIDSTRGAGTSVRVWLPLGDESMALGRESAALGDWSVAASGAGAGAWPPDRTLAGRILFVEDDPELCMMGQDALASIGLDVVVADSAERALAILAKDPPFDALVTDIVLPGLTGVQLVEAVRQAHPGLRVMYMTGYSGPPDELYTPARGEMVLRKPYPPGALRHRVADLLDPDGALGSKL